MATDTAARPTATRNLWQLPTFLLGVGAFAAVWQGVLPIGQRDPAAGFLRDVASLRGACEKLSPEPAELRSLVGRVAGAADSFPEHATPAHFALGSGYARLAELTANPDEAANSWRLARQHFDGVRPELLTDPADPPRFTFRATKARVAAGLPANPSQADLTLFQSVLFATPVGEDPGEAGRLIAELALRMTPPDLRRAREALSGYVAEAGLATPPASLARAKLRLSEVHLALGEPDAARKWLVQIPPDSPPEVLVPAKGQLARIMMAESDWAGATREWEALRAAPSVPNPVRAASAYHLGVCRLMGPKADAIAAARLFEEAAKAEGPEGPAAAVKLADLHLKSADPARHREAVGLLASAVKDAAKPAEFANPLLPLTDVQAGFELAVQVLTNDGAFESALKAAEAYRPVANAGRDREKKAEVLAAWGNSLAKAGGDGKPKFAAAAREYEALAAGQPGEAGKALMLRQAAHYHRQAGNSADALATLKSLVELPKLTDDVRGPALLEYAEALLAANQADEALKALQGLLTVGGASATAARYRLARLLIDSRDPKRVPIGVALLQQIAEASSVSAAEAEAHERALVELAHEAIRAGNFAEAESRLRKQLNIYPTGPESGLGRLLLGVCLLQRSAKPKPDAPEPAEAPKMRDEALRLFRQIVAESEAKKRAGPLHDRDTWLRLQASLRVLQTFQQMGKPNDLLVEAAPLLTEYKGSVEELIVLSLMYHAYKQSNRPELALQTRDRMKDVFAALDPSAFKAASGEYSRAYWEKVWFADK